MLKEPKVISQHVCEPDILVSDWALILKKCGIPRKMVI